MPHLLIAGTTGSGKSVAINAMILSLLYRLPPDKCKLILIDPKVIELSVYEGIPHLLTPVVTEPHKAIVALKWVVREMDDRYRLMSHLGVRDLFAYNRRIREALDRGEQLSRRVQTGFEPGTGVPVFEQQPIEMREMPLIVVVVDEVADLMLTAGKEIESAIQRLSQKARAAGIHLIVATQRPSVDVLTGVIKANLPSRISFRVCSKIDSRTILGEPGAEQLLGQGDMLHMMPGERISRIHGPLVTDEEVERVVSFLRQQGEPEYLEFGHRRGGARHHHRPIGPGLSEVPANGEEAQYAQALQIIAREGKASTSFLQRKMRIGYNSAARLIERMEADGHVSHPDHVGRRQVLIGGAATPSPTAPPGERHGPGHGDDPPPARLRASDLNSRRALLTSMRACALLAPLYICVLLGGAGRRAGGRRDPRRRGRQGRGRGADRGLSERPAQPAGRLRPGQSGRHGRDRQDVLRASGQDAPRLRPAEQAPDHRQRLGPGLPGPQAQAGEPSVHEQDAAGLPADRTRSG